jgi:hypothetical protein
MIRPVSRFLLVIILTAGVATPAHSQVYLYTGNNPMAKMMLDFMEVMGFIHRLPDRYAAGLGRSSGTGWNTFPTSSLWGMNPYTGMSSLAAPMAMSSMMAQPGMGGWPMPGTMGNLSNPANLMNYSGFNASKPALPAAALPENGKIQLSFQELQQLLGERNRNSATTAPVASVFKPGISSLPPAISSGESAAKSPITKKHDELTGLWMGSGRDILTITANRFVWTDPGGRTTKGSFKIQGDTMLVQADTADTPATYQISYSGDRMVATNKAGYRYEFTRAK